MAQSDRRIDIERELRAGRTVQFSPRGWSMYPLFTPGRDWAIVAPACLPDGAARGRGALARQSAQKLANGDVVVYRRDDGMLVIHRICRVRRLREAGDAAHSGGERGKDMRREECAQAVYDLIGDNQITIEHGIRREQILGVLVGYVRKGREHAVTEWHYRLLSALWLEMLPLRPLGFKLYGKIKRTI